MAKKHIVIVGGGFGGVRAALILADTQDFELTLVTDHPDFRYYPSLYRTATGGRRIASSIDLDEIFDNKDLQILSGSITSLDRAAQTITLADKQVIHYDSLILSLGVRTNFFHIEGLPEFSYGIKTTDDALKLKQHIHQQLLEEHKLDLNYVVIGGGPTGVELAGALPAYLRWVAKNHAIKHPSIRIELVEAAPRLLPRMPKDISRMIARRLRKLGVKLYVNTAVKGETHDALMLEGKSLASHTVIWTAGVANQPFFADNVFQMTKTGKVRVNQYLEAEPNIFVIGDNADTPYSGMAQTALLDGSFVANNLIRQNLDMELKTYTAKRPIYVIPAGPNWSAVLWGKFRMYGWLGSSLRSLADLIAYHDYEPWQLATKRWITSEDTEESCPICAQA
jgi:NADH dehydrogenase FAD-containing subunit